MNYDPLVDVTDAERDLLLWVVLLEPHCGLEFNTPETPQCMCGERVEDCVVRQYVTSVLGPERAEKVLNRRPSPDAAGD